MPVERLKETPSQTAGPYLHIGMLPAQAGLKLRSQERLNVLAAAGVEGTPIRVEGIVFDGAGIPVRDAAIEIWQADAKGRYDAPGFLGWGRAGADFATGTFWFETIKPGRTPWPDGRQQAPHLSLLIFARGINLHLHTRMYFDDEPEANAADPLLNAIELAPLRQTLVAKKETRGPQTLFRFDIHLQGEQETLFLDM